MYCQGTTLHGSTVYAAPMIPSRHGLPWDFTDDKQLIDLHNRREPLETIAETLGRTTSSVRERISVLRVQGIIGTPR